MGRGEPLENCFYAVPKLKRSFLKGFLRAEVDTLSENFHTVTLNPLVCIALWVDHSPMQDFTSLCLFSWTITASELGRSSKY